MTTVFEGEASNECRPTGPERRGRESSFPARRRTWQPSAWHPARDWWMCCRATGDLSCCFAVLLFFCCAILLYCCFAVLLLCCFAVLLSCFCAVLLLCCFAVMLVCCFVVGLFCSRVVFRHGSRVIGILLETGSWMCCCLMSCCHACCHLPCASSCQTAHSHVFRLFRELSDRTHSTWTRPSTPWST